MLDAARTCVEFVKGMNYEQFLKDRRTRNAVERNLEILGEAARAVSNGTRDGHPEVPWKTIIGLRNVLAHEYGEIVYEIIWTVCIDNLPPLIEQLEAMGADKPPPDEEP
jgi:uncharacterized protein with HEPN domain